MLLGQKRKEFVDLNENDLESQKKEMENLTQEGLAKAEQAVIQHAQQQKCNTEMALISNGLKEVSKGSSPYKLDPALDAGE